MHGRVWVVLVGGMCVLSGCLAASGDAGDPAEDAEASGAIAFTAPVDMLEPGAYGFEPSISVAPDGTLYMTAHKAGAHPEGTQAASWARYSRDNGATWSDMPSPFGLQRTLYGIEGDVAIDDVGRVYLVDTYAADNTIHVWRPGPDGPVWERSNPVLGSTGLDDRPWIDAHGDGILYYVGNNVAPVPGPADLLGAPPDAGLGRIWFYRSTDAGATWSLGQRSGGGGGFCGLDANKADTQRVALACDNGGGTISVAVSDDGGEGFRSVEVARGFTGLSSPVRVWIDSDTEGALYIAWIDRAASDAPADVGFARSTDDGVTWDVFDLSPLVPLGMRLAGLEKPWISAGTTGVAGITFYGWLDEPGMESGWYAHALITADGLGPAPSWSLARVTDQVSGTEPGLAPLDFFEGAIGPDNALHVVLQVVPKAPPLQLPGSPAGGPWQVVHVRQTAGPNLYA